MDDNMILLVTAVSCLRFLISDFSFFISYRISRTIYINIYSAPLTGISIYIFNRTIRSTDRETRSLDKVCSCILSKCSVFTLAK